MSDTTLTVLLVVELAGLVGLFAMIKHGAKRRAAGKPRPPRAVRISLALLGLVIVVAFPVLMIRMIMSPSIEPERQRQRLVKDGTPATAVITHVEETGTFVNRRPQVRVRLTVQPEDGPAFTSQSTWVFSVSDVQNYEVGTKVKVFYDPEHPKTAAVVGVAPSGN